MSQQSRSDRDWTRSKRLYVIALRATAALVVLIIFGGLAYLVSMDQLDGGALLLYAGVILGYILTGVWERR